MDKRRWTQLGATVLYNANLGGFLSGRLYKGDLKRICVPGFNCYSCPGAVGSCPIGALQAGFSSPELRLSFFVAGLLLTFGVLFGRLICGFACPFGFLQELLYKIPVKKLKKLRIFRFLKYGKYLALIVLVVILPIILTIENGVGAPVFCQYVCPAGTLEAGIPLLLADARLRAGIGGLFFWKLSILLVTLVSCALIYRPFCRFLCPLGAVYAPLNKVALFGLRHDGHSCTHCGACARVCGAEVDPAQRPDDPECVRCGGCVKACPHRALSLGVRNSLQKTPCTFDNPPDGGLQ